MAATSTARRSGRHRRTSDDLHATRAEQRRYYREVAAADPHRAAYEAGKANGERPGPEEPDSVHEAYNLGQTERQTKAEPKPKAAAPKPAPAGQAPLVTTEAAHQGAGFILGLVGYALVTSYLEYGWPGVTGWLSAKFLNKVTVKGSGSGAFTTTASGRPAGVISA